jgi:hypothetical protein
MKRVSVLVLLVVLPSVGLMAAQNSQTFYLNSDVRVENVRLPRGICEVSWSKPSGSRVKLTIRTDDKRTVSIPARAIEGTQAGSGVVTTVVNGVTYLVELHTRNVKFVFENGKEPSK